MADRYLGTPHIAAPRLAGYVSEPIASGPGYYGRGGYPDGGFGAGSGSISPLAGSFSGPAMHFPPPPPSLSRSHMLLQPPHSIGGVPRAAPAREPSPPTTPAAPPLLAGAAAARGCGASPGRGCAAARSHSAAAAERGDATSERWLRVRGWGSGRSVDDADPSAWKRVSSAQHSPTGLEAAAPAYGGSPSAGATRSVRIDPGAINNGVAATPGRSDYVPGEPATASAQVAQELRSAAAAAAIPGPRLAQTVALGQVFRGDAASPWPTPISRLDDDPRAEDFTSEARRSPAMAGVVSSALAAGKAKSALARCLEARAGGGGKRQPIDAASPPSTASPVRRRPSATTDAILVPTLAASAVVGGLPDLWDMSLNSAAKLAPTCPGLLLGVVGGLATCAVSDPAAALRDLAAALSRLAADLDTTEGNPSQPGGLREVPDHVIQDLGASASRRGATKPDVPAVQVLDRLCHNVNGVEVVAQVIAGLLKRHVGAYAPADSTMVEGETVTAMIQSLEKPWNLQPTDTALILRILRREALVDSSREPGANATAEGETTPVPTRDAECQPTMSVGSFKRGFPKALLRVQAKYVESAANQGVAIVRRDTFLRKSTGTFEDGYLPKTQIGSGSFGAVSLCVHTLTNELRAVKSLPKDSSGEVAKEFEVLALLDHPHIVRVFEVFEDDKSVHIAMEPMLGGTLKDAMQAFFERKETEDGTPARRRKFASSVEGQDPGEADESFLEAWIAEVMRQLLAAVRYSHDNGVVHRDLKPLNVLMTKASVDVERPRVVVCDFGVSEMMEAVGAAGRLKGVVGTPQYMAPEVFMGNSDAKADLWSLGVILYEMLTKGELPFNANNILMLSHLICGPKAPPLLEEIRSEGGKDMCRMLLTKAVEERPSAAEVIRACEAWLTGRSRAGGSWWDSAEGLSAQHSMSEAARRLRTLQQRSHFDHVVMACVASQLNLTQLATLSSIFEKYDTDGSGTLSSEELVAALKELGVPDEDSAVVVRELDTDNNGHVTYTELAAGCFDMRKDEVIGHLRVAFSIFDLDGSGFLDKQELKAALMYKEDKRTEGVNTDPSGADGRQADLLDGLLPDGTTLDELWEDLDSSKDGLVSFDEFVRYLFRKTIRGNRHLEE